MNDERNLLWKDIELDMYNLFNNKPDFVKEIIKCSDNIQYFNNSNFLTKACTFYIKCFNNKILISNLKENRISLIYDYLYSELLRFESRFGIYINEETSSKQYIVFELQRLEESIKLESKQYELRAFNYTTYSCDTIHINGDVDSPIFGISNKQEYFKTNNPVYRFTKIYRRVINSHEDSQQITNVIEYNKKLYMDHL